MKTYTEKLTDAATDVSEHMKQMVLKHDCRLLLAAYISATFSLAAQLRNSGVLTDAELDSYMKGGSETFKSETNKPAVMLTDGEANGSLQ